MRAEQNYNGCFTRLILQLRFYILTLSLILFCQPHILSQDDDVALSLRKAEGEFQNGDWAEAFKIYQRLAANHPDSVPAQVGMASSLVKLKDYPPAISGSRSTS